MRLWSLHPRYLDRQGLLALWREGLLARAVLTGATVGYRFHPQLVRFRSQPDPVAALDAYLRMVLEEARQRGYAFGAHKLGPLRRVPGITITTGQLLFERGHLLQKLKQRDPAAWAVLERESAPEPHPLFRIEAGEQAAWERGRAE